MCHNPKHEVEFLHNISNTLFEMLNISLKILHHLCFMRFEKPYFSHVYFNLLFVHLFLISLMFSLTTFLRLNNWQKYIIETYIKRSMILFNLFQLLPGEWYQWMTRSFLLPLMWDHTFGAGYTRPQITVHELPVSQIKHRKCSWPGSRRNIHVKMAEVRCELRGRKFRIIQSICFNLKIISIDFLPLDDYLNWQI